MINEQMTNGTSGESSPPKAGGAGYVLGFRDEHGFGVFTTRAYQAGEAVMVGLDDLRMPLHRARGWAASSSADLVQQVNHSYNPNCEIRLNPLRARDLVARHSIRPGAELTFDYRLAFGVVHPPRQSVHCADLAFQAHPRRP